VRLGELDEVPDGPRDEVAPSLEVAVDGLAVGAAAGAEAELPAGVDGELDGEEVRDVDMEVLADLPELQDGDPLGLEGPSGLLE
jgi:hypothetical protein